MFEPVGKLDMDTRRKYALFVGILMVAIFLRFYHLTTTPPGLYLDEAIDGDNAAEVVATGHYQVFYPEDNGREGLYINLIAILLKDFHAPHEPWVIRLPAAIAGVLTVAGVAFLGAELFGNGPGLLAAFLLATSFWHINFSRIGFRAILAPLLLTWALYFLLKAFTTRSPKAAWVWTISAGVVYGLGFYTYIAYRITPLLLLLLIPFYKKYADFGKRVLIFVAMTFAVSAPIGWYFVKYPAAFFGRVSQVAVTNVQHPVLDFATNLLKTALMFTGHGDSNWRHNLSGAPELFWPVGIIFGLGIILGCESLFRYRLRKHPIIDEQRFFPLFGTLLVFGWFVLAMLPVVASDEGIPHALRSILMLPPTVMLAALGGISLYEILKKRWSPAVAQTIGVAFLVCVAVYGYYEYFVLWAKDPSLRGAFCVDDVTMARRINEAPRSAPKYVVIQYVPGGMLAHGLPEEAVTTAFVTDSYLPEQQEAKNIHYVIRYLLFSPDGRILRKDDREIPPGALVFYKPNPFSDSDSALTVSIPVMFQ